MRITVEIASGPAAGKRLVLLPGQKALVGRASWAELSVPSDTDMSGRHFTLECDEHRCVLRDFKGSGGIRLNGGPVAEAVLKHGDRIVAGQTTFSVQMGEAELPAPAAAPIPAPGPTPKPAEPETLRGFLAALSQPLFALLDAARDPQILPLLQESGGNFESLYDGEKAKAFAAFAPYLVALTPESPFLELLEKLAWGQSWGVFLTSDKPFAVVRTHLQQFLRVQTPDGKSVDFRFFDPRVLRVFLPVCDRVEIIDFFGPVRAFLMEAEGDEALLRFTPDRAGVRMETIRLAQPIPA
jgi:hypothetical protein